MSARPWTEIVSAYEDASRLVAGALAGPGERPDLDTLRLRLRRRLDDLLTELSPLVTPDEAAEILVPLVFLLDEQIEGRLARAGGEALNEWPLLQGDLFPDGDGGDAFYERAAALLRTPGASPLVLGMYLFCLQAGFQGRLVDSPAAIPTWKARLAERLPGLPPPVPRSATTVHKARSRAFYVLVTLGALIVLHLVLFALARVLPTPAVRALDAAVVTERQDATRPATAEATAPPGDAPSDPRASRPTVAAIPREAQPPRSGPVEPQRASAAPRVQKRKGKSDRHAGHRERNHTVRDDDLDPFHDALDASLLSGEQRKDHGASRQHKKRKKKNR